MKSSKERFKAIPTCHLILIKEGKILFLRRFNTGYEDGNYSVPAGHLDGNETVLEAMKREAKEETNIDISSLKVVHVMHRKKESDERIDFFVKANAWSGTPIIMEPNKCDDLSWFKVKCLPKNTIPYIKEAIHHITRGVFYSEFGWQLSFS